MDTAPVTDTVQVVTVAMRMHILDHTSIRPGHGHNRVPRRLISTLMAPLPARHRPAAVLVVVGAPPVGGIHLQEAVQIPLEDPLHQLPLALGNGAFNSTTQRLINSKSQIVWSTGYVS